MPTLFTWCFFSTMHPSPARELLLLCVYSRVIRSHERRALGALVSLFSTVGPSPRRPTASCSLAAVRRGDCVRASWLYSFVVQRIDRYSYSYFCVCLILLLYQAGSAPLDFFLVVALLFFLLLLERTYVLSNQDKTKTTSFFCHKAVYLDSKRYIGIPLLVSLFNVP